MFSLLDSCRLSQLVPQEPSPLESSCDSFVHLYIVCTSFARPVHRPGVLVFCDFLLFSCITPTRLSYLLHPPAACSLRPRVLGVPTVSRKKQQKKTNSRPLPPHALRCGSFSITPYSLLCSLWVPF